MKISAIETGKISGKLDSKVRTKKDLTSFGINNSQTNPNSDIDTKKADEAIKTTFLSNVSFGGHTEQMRTTTYGTSGALYYKLDDATYNYYESDPKCAIGYSRHSYPNSSIEQIDGSSEYHNVYFADPEEIVSDDIKARHSFIVYDNEPKFPSLDMIKCKYFSSYNSRDLNQYCKTIYDYHERLKNADINELLNYLKIKEHQEKELAYAEEYKQKLEQNSIEAPWETNKEILNTADYYCRINRSRLYFTNEKIDYYKNRIENSKTQQGLAATLYSILDEAGPLFMERDSLSVMVNDVRYTNYGNITSKEDAINVVEKAKTALSLLEDKYTTTQAWRTLKQNEYEEEENNNTYDWIYNGREKAEEELNKLTGKLNNMAEEINRLKPFIERIEELPAQYDNAGANLQVVLDKLAKLYPKAEKFYMENAQRLLCV